MYSGYTYICTYVYVFFLDLDDYIWMIIRLNLDSHLDICIDCECIECIC